MATTEHTGTGRIALSRRGFLEGAAGLTLIIGATGLVAACDSAREDEALAAFDPNVWARITPDGLVHVQIPAAEMGQGPMTSLAAIFAEELDADWSLVRPVQVTVPRKEFGNPFFGGIVYTGGSRAVDDYYMPMRRAGAQARRLLIEAVSEHRKLPLAELSTEPGAVVHAASGLRIGYGEIVAFARPPASPPEIRDDELKSPAEFRLIGHDIPRVDVPLKVTGKAQYAMDVRVPGMLYAAVLHAPVEGERPLRVDDAGTRAVAGVTDVIALENAVAVLGTSVEATRSGKDLLEVAWSEDSPLRATSLESTLADCSAAANDLARKGAVWEGRGDVDAALAAAPRTVSAEYFADYVYHAQMEPLNATAAVNAAGDGAEIWCGTQSQTLTLLTAAETLGTTQDKIKLNQMLLGGGFGRRAELKPTYLIEALQLSKAVGKPVKVIWSREDDLRNGWFRPATAQLMRAGLDEAGRVTAWNHRMAGPSVLEFYNTIRWSKAEGRDIISMLGSDIPNYEVPDMLAEHVMVGRAARLSPWRGVATGYTKFAVESFVDELAAEAGVDPLEFRLTRLNVTDRARRVLEAVAEDSNWGGTRAPGRALGLALVEYHHSRAAGVYEISVNERNGKITVHNVWIAADPGRVIQPLNVEAQLEGSTVYGLGQTLTERVTTEGGMVQQSNFHDYVVARITDVPDIHVRVIETDNHPSGVGELSLPLVAPGIANAFYTLTGKRLRHMPLTRERVLAALSEA